MLAAGLAGFTQIEDDARGTADAVARQKGRSNQTKQPGVLLRAVRDRLLKPRVRSSRLGPRRGRGILRTPERRLSLSVRAIVEPSGPCSVLPMCYLEWQGSGERRSERIYFLGNVEPAIRIERTTC